MRNVVSMYMTGLVVLGLALSSLSCTDLNEDPITEIIEEDFNPTEAALASLMGEPYQQLRGWWMSWHGFLDSQEETADAFLTPTRPNGWDDDGIYIQLHKHTWHQNHPQATNGWGRAYDVINSANRLINQIESGELELPEELSTSSIAELRGLRAYAYYILLDFFGRVPIVTDFTDTSLPTQAERQEVYDFVVSELNEVIPELSAETGESTYGRVNQWAARGILARVYLNAEVYTGTPQWDEVIAVTNEIIDSGLFALEEDYRAPFARDNDKSVEMVWGLPYDAISGCCSNFHMKTLKPALRFVYNFEPTQPWGGSASNPQFIDTYDEDDGRLEDTWLMGPQFDDQGRGYDFTQHVPRIDAPPDQAGFHYGFPVWKYEIYSGMLGASDVDYPIVRYADVLLMKAEALLRTGDAGAAAQIVTDIRQRAFAETNPSKATLTGADLMEGSSYNYGWYNQDGVVDGENGGADIQYGRFLDELGWELAVEGHRRQQLIRFGVFTTKTWFNHTPNGDHVTVFPIPDEELSTNSNLTQNPGY